MKIILKWMFRKYGRGCGLDRRNSERYQLCLNVYFWYQELDGRHKEAWKHKPLTEPVGPWFTPKTWANIIPSLLEESKIRKFGTFFCDFCKHWMSLQQGTSHCSPIVNTFVSPIFIAESRENAIYIYCIAWDLRLFQLAERMGRGPSMGT